MNESISQDVSENFENKIISFIDERIRPLLMADGGDITVESFEKTEDGKYHIFVRLMGACGHCPAASMTLKMGVERLLMQNFQEVAGVFPV